MTIELNAHEARVLGVLIEKETTTPDQYPLSLNATVNGCNQKSNRDPVVDFTEAEVTVAYQGLMMKHLAGSSHPAGSRVEKWHHNARQVLKVDELEVAILAELLMRGPQTPGALRTRVSRMTRCETLDELGQGLVSLQHKEYVQRLTPLAGSRAERYGQLLAPGLHPDGEPAPLSAAPSPSASAPLSSAAPAAPAPSPAPPAPPTGLGVRVQQLEDEVAKLKRQLEGLASQLGADLDSGTSRLSSAYRR